jgi:hypothetical protein
VELLAFPHFSTWSAAATDVSLLNLRALAEYNLAIFIVQNTSLSEPTLPKTLSS